MALTAASPRSPRTVAALRPCGLAPLLEWVYQNQKADVMSGRTLWTPESIPGEEDQATRALQLSSGCGCAQLEGIYLLGARINSPGWQRPALHPDAEIIHDALVEMSRTDWMGATLLLRYGRTGDQPEWGEGYQDLVPTYDARDKIVQDRYDEVVAARDALGREFLVPVRYCPLDHRPSDDWVELSRGEYVMWFAALQRLAKLVAGKPFIRWRLSGLGALKEPWRTKRENMG